MRKYAQMLNDKNLYQNYFLCLRGTKGKKVNIVIKHNPPPPEAVEEEEFTEQEEYIDESEIMPIPLPPLPPKKAQSSIFSMRSLFIVVIIVGIGIGLYFLWKGGKPSVSAESTQPSIIPNIPVVTTPATFSGTKKASSPNLMSRLNKMVE